MRTRNAARLILLDELDRLLMFQYEDHSIYNLHDPFQGPFWVMPGGGLEADESFEEAAEREVWEETGICESHLSGHVWSRDIRLNWRGEIIDHHERFFVVRVKSTQIKLDNMDEDELAALQAHRWWSLEEIRTSTEIIVPPRLAELLSPVLQNELPAQPINLTR